MIENTHVAEKSARRHRFKRAPHNRMELRRRDLDMIATIAHSRFMNTAQVCRLFACDCPRMEKLGHRAGRPAMIFVKQHHDNCSCTCGVENKKREHAESCPALFKDDQHVGSRLRELYQAGYLERPIVQLQLRVKNGVVAEGSVPLVYCVTASGLSLIGQARRDALGLGKLSWVSKINEGTQVFMSHTLATVDVGVGVDVAVRKQQHLIRLSEAALLSTMSEQRRNSVRPWSLRTTYKGEPLTAVCDLAFALQDQQSRKRWNFLVEVDRGHMPIARGQDGADFSGTSIMRKLIAYAKAYTDDEHQKAFGFRGMRVLFLTTSEERVRTCIQAARDRFGSASVARLFLFGTLDAARDMLGYGFVGVDGKLTRLLD